jgi:hypothetical protein
VACEISTAAESRAQEAGATEFEETLEPSAHPQKQPGYPQVEAGCPPVIHKVIHTRRPDSRPFFDTRAAGRRGRGTTRPEQLYRVGEDPLVFLEQFEMPTWAEHQRQHDNRLTAEDKAIEEAAFAHITGRPRTQDLLPVEAEG